MNKPFYKKWWGVLLVLLFLPFFLTYWIAKKQNWSMKEKVAVIAGIWLFFLFVYAMLPDSKTATQQTATQIASNTQPATPTQPPAPTEVKRSAGSTKRASTPEGEALYKQIEKLSTDGAVKGKLFAEFEGDPIVDANPQTQSVQLGLQYDYEGELSNDLKNEIAVDYDMIKALAEENTRLLMPGTKQLRLFVITYHDRTGKGRGEVQQLYIDDEPQWSEW